MKVIGFSSGVTGRVSNVDRMVKAILDQSGGDSEFVKLTDLSYSGCKGCVQLCAAPQVCRLQDDLLPYYQKVKEADAVVVGSPVYMGDVNAALVGLIERFFGYRHVKSAIRRLPFILALCGHAAPRGAVAPGRTPLTRPASGPGSSTARRSRSSSRRWTSRAGVGSRPTPRSG